MKLALLKYNAGNIRSVENTLNRLGIEPILTDDISVLNQMDKIIFPGVGEAKSAMNYLKERSLDIFIKNYTKPFLGICLGMQLLCKSSEEGNYTECLGKFDVNVKKFPLTNKVPHMGWNQIYNLKSDLFKDIDEGSFVYFVHSYYAEQNDFSICTCDYIEEFSAGIVKDNFYSLQFHPEKSGSIGQKILSNFIKI